MRDMYDIPVKITLHNPNEQVVKNYRDPFFLPSSPPTLHWKLISFFGDELWFDLIEVVALLWIREIPAGMASLAPCDADRKGGPSIISIWVDVEVSQFFRDTYAPQMLRELFNEAVNRYGATYLDFEIIHKIEFKCAVRAMKMGVPLRLKCIFPLL